MRFTELAGFALAIFIGMPIVDWLYGWWANYLRAGRDAFRELWERKERP